MTRASVSACHVCSGVADFVFQRLVLRRHLVSYYLCPGCGSISTERPYWLGEAYESAIARLDTGLVERSRRLSLVCSSLLWAVYGAKGRYVDAGGGYGLLTRMMRDEGLDYYWSDAFADNLLARGFEAQLEDGGFDAATMFEVLEHLEHPLEVLRELVRGSGIDLLIASTEVLPSRLPEPDEWWYYLFDTGQHITFYSRQSLAYMGAELGMSYLQVGGLHLWTTRKLHRRLLVLLAHPWAARLAALLRRRSVGSLVQEDFVRLGSA